jgi:two-component system cell cycle response regulator DivK
MAQTILIVEDNLNNLCLLRDILTFHGYHIESASDGQEGIELARQLRPDLIVMDIQMPLMDGMTACTILKNDPQTSGLKIIALTSFAMHGDKEKFLKAGFNGYLCKPVNTRELPDQIRTWLEAEEST